MSDITTVWRTSSGDWQMAGAALQSGDDLQTCLAIMLFTDRVADPSDVIPDGTADPRGWWGDAFRPRPIGSKLWQYDRAKEIPDTLTGVRNAAQIALAPLVKLGIAARVDVAASWNGPGFLLLQTDVVQPGGLVSSYAWAWMLNGGG